MNWLTVGSYARRSEGERPMSDTIREQAENLARYETCMPGEGGKCNSDRLCRGCLELADQIEAVGKAQRRAGLLEAAAMMRAHGGMYCYELAEAIERAAQENSKA